MRAHLPSGEVVSDQARVGEGGRAQVPRTGTAPARRDMAWAHDLRRRAKLVGLLHLPGFRPGQPRGLESKATLVLQGVRFWEHRQGGGWAETADPREPADDDDAPAGDPRALLTLDVPAREKQVWLQGGGAVSRPGSPPCPRTGRPGPWFISIRPGASAATP